MIRRDDAGARLFTRRGYDWTERFPAIVNAARAIPAKSFLIDGEAVCCDESGVPVFQMLPQRRNESTVFLYAFDLLQLDGRDLWREPIEARKADSPSLQSLCPANHCSSSWFVGRLSPSDHTVRRRMRLITDDCVASSAVREDRATMGSLCSIEPRRGRL